MVSMMWAWGMLLVLVQLVAAKPQSQDGAQA